MKNQLTFLTIIVVSAVLFFILRGNVTRNNMMQSTRKVTVYPTIQKTENLANEIPLTINEPENNATVSTPNIVVSGTTAPGADIIVNDVELKADGQGNFSTSYILDPGNNIIDIVANDENGKYSERELVIQLQDSSEAPQ